MAKTKKCKKCGGTGFEKPRPRPSTDAETRLYSIPTADGRGWTCLGWDVLERRLKGVRAFLADGGADDPIKKDARPGTLARLRQYNAMMRAGAAYHKATGRRCSAELEPRLVGLEGKRIEVENADEGKRRFIVGKSTGWLPIHLEIANCRSTGGPSVYITADDKIKVVRG